MLIDKKDVSVGEVAALRLTTGEELVGKVLDLTSTAITLSKPVIIQMQMVSQTQAGIGFAPFMVSVDEDSKFTILLAKLVCAPMKARKDIAGNYLKATTGLEIPTGGLVL